MKTHFLPLQSALFLSVATWLFCLTGVSLGKSFSGSVTLPGKTNTCNDQFLYDTGNALGGSVLSLACATNLGLGTLDAGGNLVPMDAGTPDLSPNNGAYTLWCFSNVVVSAQDSSGTTCSFTQTVYVAKNPSNPPGNAVVARKSILNQDWINEVGAGLQGAGASAKGLWPNKFVVAPANRLPVTNAPATFTNRWGGWHRVGTNEWIGPRPGGDGVLSATNVFGPTMVGTNGIEFGTDGWRNAGTNRWVMTGTNNVVPYSTNGWDLTPNGWVPLSTNGWIRILENNTLRTVDSTGFTLTDWTGKLNLQTNGSVLSPETGEFPVGENLRRFAPITYNVQAFESFIVNPDNFVSEPATCTFASASELSFIPRSMAERLGMMETGEIVDLPTRSPDSSASLGLMGLNQLQQTDFKTVSVAVDYQVGGLRRFGTALVIEDPQLNICVIGANLLTEQYVLQEEETDAVFGFIPATSPDVASVTTSSVATGTMINLRWLEMGLFSYTVQSSPAVINPEWTNLPGYEWPLFDATEIEVAIDLLKGQEFLQVLAEPLE